MTKAKAKIVIFLLYLFISDSVEKEMDEIVEKWIFKASIWICFKTVNFKTYIKPYCIVKHKIPKLLIVSYDSCFKALNLAKTERN